MPKIEINSSLDFEDKVTMVCPNPEFTFIGVITGVCLRMENYVTYEVSWNDRTVSFHYESELEKVK